jgi:hypothetical protein
VNKILLIIIAAFLLPGCGLFTGPMTAMLVDSGPDFVNVSASESVATIRGQSHYGPFWTVTCWIEKPAKAKKLKIDAGLTYITAMCSIWLDDCCPDESAAFSFTAIAGHEYRVRRRMRPDAVIELVDDTDNVVIDIDKAVKKEGLQREWHDNGQLMRAATFKDGKREGLDREWYENGQLKFEYTYKNGKEEGLGRWWYEDGRLDSEICFANGEEVDMAQCEQSDARETELTE